jgi:hypothetical protein
MLFAAWIVPSAPSNFTRVELPKFAPATVTIGSPTASVAPVGVTEKMEGGPFGTMVNAAGRTYRSS